jgi:uncharacterized hydantoinase/oxoprolinase family protein
MRELFAITGDIYLTSGDIPEDPDDLSTANGRPATRVEARHRLARLIGLDYEHFTEQDAASMASQIDKKVVKIIEKSLQKVMQRLPDQCVEQVVISGSGSFLGQRIAGKFVPETSILNLETVWGPDQASAACAVALVKLAERTLNS